MTSLTILAVGASLGALICGGVLLVALALRGFEPSDPSTPARRRVDLRGRGARLLLGGGTFVVVLAVTRWVVFAAALGALVAMWDKVAGGSAVERRAIVRLDALASWTESLRDTIAGAVGLEQAIPATTVNASTSIRPALNLLVDRLRVREPLPGALLKFADDLDDPSADLIVAALILNARLRGPGLREVLSALSTSAREELDLRRRVEGSRRSTRRSVQIVLAVSVFVVGGIVLFNGEYVEPYGTPQGQLALTGIIVLFGLGILWLRRLAGVESAERFLVRGRHEHVVVAGDVVEA